MIHMDQAESGTPGRPMTYSGKNNQEKIYVFTLFVDSISKKIFVEFQTSSNAQQTLVGKSKLETNTKLYSRTVKLYRADNGIFQSNKFRDDVKLIEQPISFSGNRLC